MKSKKSILNIFAISMAILLLIGIFNAIIDPYFHYHKPIKGLSYPLEYERYQNDGILKNFEYDAIIAGTSMTQNFKTSELDELFGTNSIKIPSSGGSYKEINDDLAKAFKTSNSIKIVVRGLDESRLLDNKDVLRYEKSEYPDYLYDDNLLNDVKYLLNKSTLMSSVSVVINTILGNESTTFDEYSNWNDDYSFGKESVNYKRGEKTNIINELSKNDMENINGNIDQNVINLAKQNPETEFYLFFTPYSICYFDNLHLSGDLEKQLDAEKIIIEKLIKYNNIHLFSFFNDFEMICNLNNYRDITHYGEWVNSYILKCMKDGSHEITKENYLDYCTIEKEFYLNYDYDGNFE